MIKSHSLTGLCLITGLLASASVTAGKTEHDNDVWIHTNGLTDCSFTETDHSISSGQPYSGVTSKMKDGKCKVTIKAGRHGSSEVAKWFSSEIDTGAAIACDSSGPMPDKLNFAVEGTLVLTQGDQTTTCENVILAQGHFGFTNNWWMGSPDVNSGGIPFVGPLTQKCSAGGVLPKVVVYTPPQPCVNNFTATVNQ